MSHRYIAPVFLCVAAALYGPAVHADDMSDARNTGSEILDRISTGKSLSVWDSYVSDWFKERMTKDAFLANMAMVKAQQGGAGEERTLIQQNKSDGAPQFGFKKSVYSFTFSTNFPSGKVYETIVLIREGSEYKVSGLNYLPNPN